MDVFEFAHPICPNYDILPPILANLISHRSKESFLRDFLFLCTIIKASNNGSIWRQCGEEVNLEGLPRGEINRKAISGPSEEPMFHEANEAHLPETKLCWKRQNRNQTFCIQREWSRWSGNEYCFYWHRLKKRKKYLWRIPIDIINTIAPITSEWYEVSWPVRIV